MINNLEKLQPFLQNQESDLVYYGQIIRRRKDWGNGGLEKPSYVVHTFTFSNYEDLKSKFGYLKNLANSTGSRIYINCNRRSKKHITEQLLIKLSHRIGSQSYDGLQGDYASQLGKFHKEPKHSIKWMLDIDECVPESLNTLRNFLQEVRSVEYVSIPTISGLHLLVAPFPSSKFPTLPNIECKKDSFVLLYYKFGE